jgi:hypothetical protein
LGGPVLGRKATAAWADFGKFQRKIEMGCQGHWAKLKDRIGRPAETDFKFYLGFKNQRIQNIFKLKFELGQTKIN